MLQNPFPPHQCLLWRIWGAGQPHGGTLQCLGSGRTLPCPPWCTSLLKCCPLSQLEIQNCASNIFGFYFFFQYLLQHRIIPDQITSLARATSLAFVNVLKDPQRVTFYQPYQSSVLQLHTHVFSLCKFVSAENTFQ